ncbi:hypothetical protein RQP46_005343 [Phenoliferia psychrophenolica]
MRSIQTILLLAFFHHNNGLLSEGFTVAPQHAECFYQQLGSRLWWWLCSYDWDVSYRTRNMSVLRSQDFSIPAPLNLDDEDLSAGPIDGRPLTHPTIATFGIIYSEVVFITQQWSRPSRTLEGNTSVLERMACAETVMRLDMFVNDILGRIPSYFHLQSAKEAGVDVSHHYVPLQRLFLNKEAYTKLARMHRHRIFETAEQSPRAGRVAAFMLLAIVQEFTAKFESAFKFWWVPTTTLLACCILLVSNIHSLSTNILHALPATLENARSSVLASLAALRDAPPSASPLSAYTSQAIRVLSLLVAEEEAVALRANSDQPVDTERLLHALKVVAHATLCVAPEETRELEQLADSVFSTSSFASAAPPASPPPNVPHSVDDPHLSLPFAAAPGFGAAEESYDDYFRRCGVV